MGSVLELWDIDVFDYPYIDVEIKFDSGSEQISTPIFYGYSFGTEFGLTFNDLRMVTGLDVCNDGVLDYVHDNGLDIYIDSSSFHLLIKWVNSQNQFMQ